MKTRSKKAIYNIVVLAIYELISFACNLILPRLILQSFGSEYNGIVSSVTQFLNFMLILRMGISGPTRVALYKALANNNDNKVSGIIKATEIYMRKIGFILIMYIALLAIIFPFISTSSISPTETMLLVLIIGIGAFAEYFWGITAHILLSADQTQYVYYLLQSVSTVLSTIAAVVLINFGANIIEVRIAAAVFFVLTPIILNFVVKKKYNLNKHSKPDNAGLKDRWNAMGHSIANIIHSFTDITVLTLLVDIKIVSVYTVYYLVFNAIKKIMNIFTTGLEAGFGNMLARNEITGANKIFDIFEFLMYSFSSVIYSCTLVLIMPFISLYTRGINDVNYIVPLFAFLAILAQISASIRQPYLTVVQAAGHYKQTRTGAFLEATINVVLSVVLTYYLGLIGVIIGTLVANLFRTTQYVFYLRKNILKRKITIALKLILWLFINILVIYLININIINAFANNNWLDWIISGVTIFSISLIITVISALIFFNSNLLNSMKYFIRLITNR